jgi:hypothetical protein
LAAPPANFRVFWEGSGEPFFAEKIIALAPFGGMKNDFQKEDYQGENPFAKGFSPWTLFPKTPILLRRREEKWLIGAPAHDKWVRFQLTVKILEFLPEGSGTGFLHKKRVPDIFPLPPSPRQSS